MAGDSPDHPASAAPPGDDLAQPRVVKTRRWRLSLVWLLPLLAVGIGVLLLVRTVFLAGPYIEIEFASAQGVEAGKTDGPLQGGGHRQGEVGGAERRPPTRRPSACS